MIKIGIDVSNWMNILKDFSQCSLLKPILFHIFINNPLLFIRSFSICNFENDNSIQKCGPKLSKILTESKRIW